MKNNRGGYLGASMDATALNFDALLLKNIVGYIAIINRLLRENAIKRRSTDVQLAERRERQRERERILFATALQAYQKGYEPI